MGKLTIQELEHASGILRDTLRIWEKRYGFPAPSRNSKGERVYDRSTVEQLALITRLLDAGHRIGRIATLSLSELMALLPERTNPYSDETTRLLEVIRRLDSNQLYGELSRLRQQHGAYRFVRDLVAPLNHAVGEAWFAGQIGVLEEHCYSEQVGLLLKQLLREEQQSVQVGKILMATMPGEQHAVGLLMAACVCHLEGLEVLYAGPQTPLDDIVRGATTADCHVVGISCSPHGNRRVIAQQLVRLRRQLPESIALWVGGAGIESIPALPKTIRLFSDLAAISTAVKTLS